jgi:PadR family transcriptional regulator PadR
MAESIQVQLRKGTLELCALAVLARGENYGYEIANILVSTVSMGEGTIYPLMRRMQNEGLVATRIVESSSGPARKYYSLTPQGRDTLQTHLSDWRIFSDSVNRLLEDSP